MASEKKTVEPSKEEAELKKEPEQREVLPSNVRPIHYQLSYTDLDMQKGFTFSGHVTIDLSIEEDNVTQIVLNSEEIQYKSITVTQKDSKQEIKCDSIQENKKSQQITIPLKETQKLMKGSAQLCIAFTGILNDKLCGFYRSKYVLANGKDAFCGCTQFEPVDARLAFPCWDEPSAKATFTVQITCPKELVCLSNMPVEKETNTENADLKTVLFGKSPKMSTYLLAWVIGEFEYIESKSARGVVIRIYTTIGKKKQAEYALETAVRCLDFYEKYFEIDFPLPKCDMIAVPDFAAGAMENWGLITYREVRLLCDPKTAALRVKQAVARVICHELAHMWFGNLVTMEWWSQLWLNEGFASFMQYLSADSIRPELNIWSLYITRENSISMRLDGMTSSHAVEVPVLTAKSADEVFDAISYCKGACIIVMLQSFLGDDDFRNGLKNYLNHFSYSNAVTTDLWRFLSESSKKDIHSIMGNWTSEQGFPKIECSISDKSKGKLLLKQARYLANGSVIPDNECVIWNVPIVVKIDGKIHTVLLDKKEKEFVIKDIEKCKYVHLNSNSRGFYVTQYSDEMSGMLLQSLTDLTDIDRIVLVRDLVALSKSGYQKDATEQLLNLVKSSVKETSYVVWDELLTAIGSIYKLVGGDKAIQEQFKGIVLGVLDEVYKGHLNGFNGEKDDEKQKADIERNGVFRPLIISAMAKYGNKDVINELCRLFDERIVKSDDKCNIDDCMRSIVYSNAMKNGGKKEYDALMKYYLNTKDEMDKRRALTCLGYASDKELLGNTLKWVKDSDDVRKQDKVFAIGTVSRNPIGRDLAWEFLKSTFDEWTKIYDGGFLLNSLLKCPSSFVDSDKADDVEKFYATLKDCKTGQKSMRQCVESIRLNAKWKNAQIGNIKKWCVQNAK